MNGPLTLFDTTEQIRAAEYNQRLAEFMEARRVEAGFQCPDCGGIARNEVLYWNNHGLMGTRCQAERFARNHATYDLRHGDLARWRESSTRLRAIAAWRQHQRRNP